MAHPLPSSPERLVSDRLVLMPRGPEHAAALFDGFSDPEVWRYIPREPPDSVGALAARFARTKAGPVAAGERWWNWVVGRREATHTLFGTVEVSLFDDGCLALLAYIFSRASWGRGYAYEACATALAYVRQATRAAAVESIVDSRNLRSIALVERLGFRRIATLVAADHFKGSQSDEHRYRLETS